MPAIGAIVSALFGAVWLAWWCLAALGGAPASLLAVAVGAVVLCAVAVKQLRSTVPAGHRFATGAPRPGVRRLFGVVNLVQWIAIVGAALLLPNIGLGRWLLPVVILIVGLHFLPLAAGFRFPLLYFTAIGMLLVAVIYPFASSRGPADPVGALGAGLVLWATAVGALAGRREVRGKEWDVRSVT